MNKPGGLIVDYLGLAVQAKRARHLHRERRPGQPDLRHETSHPVIHEKHGIAYDMIHGFDQPKLVAMYVDKKLSGVACVQTLSSLNRTTAGKEETFVPDFENTAEDIEKGFQPFYDRVTLSKETDAHQLYNIRTDLDKFAIHEVAVLEAFAKEWFSAKRSVEKLQGVVNPVAKKWQAEAEDDQVDYKSKARDFVKLYSFLIEDLNTRSGACHGL